MSDIPGRIDIIEWLRIAGLGPYLRMLSPEQIAAHHRGVAEQFEAGAAADDNLASFEARLRLAARERAEAIGWDVAADYSRRGLDFPNLYRIAKISTPQLTPEALAEIARRVAARSSQVVTRLHVATCRQHAPYNP